MRSEGAVSNGFILPDGTVAKKGTQHDDIAMEFICDHKLSDRYNKSKYRDLCDFMVYELRAIKVGCNGGSRRNTITFIANKMNDEQWEYIKFYQDKGYYLDIL